MKKILILTDKRGYLASSKVPGKLKADPAVLKEKLIGNGYEVEIKSIHDISFPSKYIGWYVVYPSSEDPGLFYKNYIEDILLGLQKDGAVLLPWFELFRAHHNKLFMEILRKYLGEEFNTIESVGFYDVDDFLSKEHLIKKYPIVIKASQGTASSGVFIAHDRKEALALIRKKSGITYFSAIYTPYIKLKKTIKKQLSDMGFIKKELYKLPAREKLIAQNFISDLKCDYKVLVFGERFFVLRRKTRDNDFRASGSGKFEFPVEIDRELESVLNYACLLFSRLRTPMLSADIAYDGNTCHLMEFQCVNFGAYTLEFSDHYYVLDESGWKAVTSTDNTIEHEMAHAISCFIMKR